MTPEEINQAKEFIQKKLDKNPELMSPYKALLILILLIFVAVLVSIQKCGAQTPVMYGGGNNQHSELTTDYIILDSIKIKGYWKDSVFVSGRRKYLFKPDRVELIVPYISGGTVYKKCSLSYGEYAYWNVSKIVEDKKTSIYINGFDTDGNKVVSVQVQSVELNTFTKIVKADQNGLIFYLSDPVQSNLN